MLALLAACKQPTTQEVEAIVQGSNSVQIETLQILPDGTGTPPADVFYVCKVLFVNTSSTDVTPSPANFVFTGGRPRASYRALTTGLPPGVDAINPSGPVKAGDKQEYTLVFRPVTGATGTIAYQP
jgi:hypothetical protein